eukprot:m.130152 g.130152  ORF g.130152 m.130152 type:complete len:226 (-) comp14768_c0_seq2:31-708(-)
MRLGRSFEPRMKNNIEWDTILTNQNPGKMAANDLREIKLCLLGDAGVGKSSLVYRFVSDAFSPNLEATIGASFMSKTLLVDGKTFKYQIWDTAGQEKYRGLAPMYYRGAAAAVLVYDITRADSLNTLKVWVRELQQMGPQDIVMAIVGNKLDLKKDRQVETATARTYADSVGAIFLEASALTSENVLPLFEAISRRLPQSAQQRIAPVGVDLQQAPPPPRSRGWC